MGVGRINPKARNDVMKRMLRIIALIAYAAGVSACWARIERRPDSQGQNYGEEQHRSDEHRGEQQHRAGDQHRAEDQQRGGGQHDDGH